MIVVLFKNMSNSMVLRALELGGLLIVLALVSLRPLVTESYDSAPPSVSAALQGLSDPTPVRTLIFDMATLAALAIWIGAYWRGRAGEYRWTGLELGWVMLLLAGAGSCVLAGQKRLAINATFDWLCLPLLTIVLVQFLDRPWRRRLLLATVLASSCAQAVQCFDQYFVSFAETWEHYQSIKTEFWAAQGIALDSSHVELFERRMMAREASGFFPHSNVAGSYLVLCGMAALGTTADAWRRAAGAAGYLLAGLRGALTVLLFSASLLTGSRGAWVSGLVALAAWPLLHWARSWIGTHRRLAFGLGWAVALAGAGAVVGHGLNHQSLPGMSLRFRWEYWSATAPMIAEHPLFGVGRENFGRHYLNYKPIENPEEISNPHNLLVHAAAEWGVVGAGAILLMALGATWRLSGAASARRKRVQAGGTRTQPMQSGMEAHIRGVDLRQRADAASHWIWPWALGLGAVTLGLRAGLIGTDNLAFVYVGTVLCGLPWIVGFLAFNDTRRCGESAAVSTGEAGCGATETGVLLGLGAFVLHDMINFALFVPGAAVTFFALLAYRLSAENSIATLPASSAKATHEDPRAPRPLAVWLLGACALGIMLLAVGVVRPVVRCVGALRRASAAMLQDRAQFAADAHFQTAAEADPLDPTPWAARGEWQTAISSVPSIGTSALLDALTSYQNAEKRDPFNVAYPRRRTQIFEILVRQPDARVHLDGAINAARRALSLYPADPVGWVRLGDLQSRAGEVLQRAASWHEAAESYRRALALDVARPEYEKIRRFREHERQAIEEKIARAQSMAESQGEE